MTQQGLPDFRERSAQQPIEHVHLGDELRFGQVLSGGIDSGSNTDQSQSLGPAMRIDRERSQRQRSERVWFCRFIKRKRKPPLSRMPLAGGPHGGGQRSEVRGQESAGKIIVAKDFCHFEPVFDESGEESTHGSGLGFEWKPDDSSAIAENQPLQCD